MKKKILSSMLIGAFIFGVSAANIQTVSASSPEKEIGGTYDKIFVSDSSNRPEPPKDKDGNPIAPPNFNGDNSNRHEPPKDKDGNPIAPPNFNGDNSNRHGPPKDKDGNPIAPPNFNGDNSNRHEPPKDKDGKHAIPSQPQDK